MLIVTSLAYSLAKAEDADQKSDTIPSQEVVVIDKQFGLFSITDEGIKFTSAATVPLVEKQAYGWRLRVNTKQSQISVREEFELPVAPKTWGNIPDNAISNDRKTSTQKIALTPDRGYIENVWEVAPGDPVGNYVIRVFIDDKLAAKFEFKVK